MLGRSIVRKTIGRAVVKSGISKFRSAAQRAALKKAIIASAKARAKKVSIAGAKSVGKYVVKKHKYKLIGLTVGGAAGIQARRKTNKNVNIARLSVVGDMSGQALKRSAITTGRSLAAVGKFVTFQQGKLKTVRDLATAGQGNMKAMYEQLRRSLKRIDNAKLNRNKGN